MRPLLTQLMRFGLVGGVGLIIDIAVFNALRLTVLAPEVIDSGPLIAKAISTSVAIASNWIGNRYWTFAATRRPQAAREGAAFALVSIGGMLIGLACLWTSHYVLGYTSVLADNISGNVIGLALGTAFRFWLYRSWVFAGTPTEPTAENAASALAPHGRLAGLLRLLRLTPRRDRVDRPLHEVVEGRLHEVGPRHVVQHDRPVEARVDPNIPATEHGL